MSASSWAPIDLGSMIQAHDPIEALLLLTRTGKELGAWTRGNVPTDVLTVMAATLIGSIETINTALGGSAPREIDLIVDNRRMLAFKVNQQVAIVVIASATVSEPALRTVADRIRRKLPPLPGEGPRGRTPREGIR